MRGRHGAATNVKLSQLMGGAPGAAQDPSFDHLFPHF
jgi:hypothetical protein